MQFLAISATVLTGLIAIIAFIPVYTLRINPKNAWDFYRSAFYTKIYIFSIILIIALILLESELLDFLLIYSELHFFGLFFAIVFQIYYIFWLLNQIIYNNSKYRRSFLSRLNIEIKERKEDEGHQYTSLHKSRLSIIDEIIADLRHQKKNGKFEFEDVVYGGYIFQIISKVEKEFPGYFENHQMQDRKMLILRNISLREFLVREIASSIKKKKHENGYYFDKEKYDLLMKINKIIPVNSDGNILRGVNYIFFAIKNELLFSSPGDKTDDDLENYNKKVISYEKDLSDLILKIIWYRDIDGIRVGQLRSLLINYYSFLRQGLYALSVRDPMDDDRAALEKCINDRVNQGLQFFILKIMYQIQEGVLSKKYMEAIKPFCEIIFSQCFEGGLIDEKIEDDFLMLIDIEASLLAIQSHEPKRQIAQLKSRFFFVALLWGNIHGKFILKEDQGMPDYIHAPTLKGFSYLDARRFVDCSEDQFNTFKEEVIKKIKK